MRAIKLDLDLDGADRARAEIAAQVKEIEAGRVGQTPVKLAGVLKHFSAGQSDEKVIVTQILDGLTESRSETRRLHSQLMGAIQALQSVMPRPSLTGSSPSDWIDPYKGIQPLPGNFDPEELTRQVWLNAGKDPFAAIRDPAFTLKLRNLLDDALKGSGDEVVRIDHKLSDTGSLEILVLTKSGKVVFVPVGASASADATAKVLLARLALAGRPGVD
jgi:hypothetical protein